MKKRVPVFEICPVCKKLMVLTPYEDVEQWNQAITAVAELFGRSRDER
jgi:hypothetical protein